MPPLLERLRTALGDRYAIEREIGRGGMAHVFLAEDRKHHRRVAIKLLRPELVASVGAERFLREIGIAGQLAHPHILPLHDSGEAPGLLYYVMPYVDGESLRDRLRRERQLPLEDALEILREVADALAYAHSVGVVHRDIKPENVLLHEGHAVVSDFGVARAMSLADREHLTESGMVVGTPAYMSPEQASGDALIDGRSDVYSLASVFYEMLAGEPPYAGPTPQAILARQLSGEVRSLTPVRSVTPGLDAALRKALARSPADRFATATQFAAAVQDALDGTAARGSPERRRPWRTWVGAAIAAAGLGGLGGWWLMHTARAASADTVAVLPFTNVGGEAGNQAFVDGLVEILTSKLTQLEQFYDRPLWVVPATEMRAVVSADEARRRFGVTMAVTGSVQRQDARLQVTLNLVDAKTLRQVGSSVLQGRMDDLATWQDGVVGRLTEMLDVRLRPEARRMIAVGETSDPGAYDAYVESRGFLQGARSRETLEAAVERLSRAIARDPGYALAYAGLGEAYWRLYEETRDTLWVARAIANSRRALALSDSLPAVWVTLGVIAAGTGRYADAVRDLRRALALDSYNSEAYRELATAYGRLGRADSAEATYRRAIALRPYDWRGYNSLGVFYVLQGRYEEAVEPFLRVVELAPMSARGYRNAGGTYFFLERWDEARAMLERSLAIQPSAPAFSNIGTIDFYEGRYASAARRFEQAIALTPENYLLWGNLGDAYAWVPGARERSREAYRRALELAQAARRVNPNDPKVLSHVLDYRAALGERGGAREVLAHLLPRIGEDPELMFSVARAYELLGEREQALAWLSRALAVGYSRKAVERHPELRELRSDPRYRALEAPSSH